LLVLSGVVFAAGSTAQCQFSSVSQQTYGTGCNPVFLGNNPLLAVRLDPQTCTVSMQVTAFSGCCNTLLRDRLLAIGLTPVNVPLPQFGPGCTLLASLDQLFIQPVQAGDTFVLTVPSGLPLGFVFYAQAAAHYFTTIGFSDDLAFSAGDQVTLN